MVREKEIFSVKKNNGWHSLLQKAHLNDFLFLFEFGEAGEVTRKYAGNPPVLYIDFF